MYAELDNIFPYVINEHNKKEKEDTEKEIDDKKKREERAQRIASDLAQMQK